ncbi:4-hydroxybenzoate octaprenyltransferase [Terasakiella pusilla]|uniref:4-hydroxybenzoate octaprenyltransferase n=1 Tax=Terasakiella pusilla TaxID=64973 RepID=UPI003AA96008
MIQNKTTTKSDIIYQGWVGQMPRFIQPYLILMRADRPIGTWLLLFPCWWSLSLAADLWPNVYYMALMAFGAFVMRGAGCVMNDIADRHFDGQVARTATRPLPNGDVSLKQAIAFMGGLCLIGLGVLVQFNNYTIMLGIASLGLVFIYPFCKRWTYWPQAILGLTFNWGALVGWAAVQGQVGWAAVCLYFAGWFWTMGYDTIYAHQDKDDDIMIGVKSSALKLGAKTRPALWVLYLCCLGLIGTAGYLAGVSLYFYIGLAACAAHLVWQIVTLDIYNPDRCLYLFKANRHFGWILLATILLGKL